MGSRGNISTVEEVDCATTPAGTAVVTLDLDKSSATSESSPSRKVRFEATQEDLASLRATLLAAAADLDRAVAN
jgi:hypothetical protein